MKSDFVRTFASELDNFVKLFKCLSKPFGKLTAALGIDFGKGWYNRGLFLKNKKTPLNQIRNPVSNWSRLFVLCFV